MKHTYNFSLLLLPLVLLVALAVTLFVQRVGIQYTVEPKYYTAMQFLPQENVNVFDFFPDKPANTVVIYESDNAEKYYADIMENLYATLSDMRVKYDVYGVNSPKPLNLDAYQTAIVVVLNPTKAAELDSVLNWMYAGGNVLFLIRPDPADALYQLLPRVGVAKTAGALISTKGVVFTSDLLPGAEGRRLGRDFIDGRSYDVELEDDCNVHLVSGDGNDVPLLWDCERGGRVVFINSDQFSNKAARGIVASAYTLTQDVVVYPVINASVFFIDDFPAPLPEGQDDYITRDYPNMDSSTFFSEVWWPEMQDIAETYNIRYTAGIIETYTQVVTPPLYQQAEQEPHNFFGRSLLSMGGEIIFHGHNHVPLCTAADDANQQFGYPSWSNTESAQLSMLELYTFAKGVFPDYNVLGYIPPSNVLCFDARRWLPLVVPNLKLIAGVYLPLQGLPVYVQEFSEASDGIVELPRVTSSYNLVDDEYMQWAAINEIAMHYVNSHFLHPDDILDPDRGAEKGWENLRDQYIKYIAWLQEAAPGLRNMTSSEAAMAVQRYSRLALMTELRDNSLEVSLGNFYDEAWLILRSTRKPVSVEGGVIVQITADRYLLQALAPEAIINFEELP
ncbi:MAG: hypothetical protein DCC59_10195 [Chloroflexi bacterium]|nr:hypothetical protein [Chloroflexota bacterium]MDL1920785.1 DUF2194 domain-containing protein [Chloroflexi bacterium CFX5]RIK52428.1 MAG: hypothetical protein DCC59_10195 [Chloroflexota bacterium]